MVTKLTTDNNNFRGKLVGCFIGVVKLKICFLKTLSDIFVANNALLILNIILISLYIYHVHVF